MPHNHPIWFNIKIYFSAAGLILTMLAVYNPYLAALGAALIAAAFFYIRQQYLRDEAQRVGCVQTMKRHVGKAAYYALQELPVGIAIIDTQGNISWHNRVLSDWQEDKQAELKSIIQLWPQLPLDSVTSKAGQSQIQSGHKHFQIVHQPLEESEAGGLQLTLLYVTDVTASQLLRERSIGAMPVLTYLQMDNYADAVKGLTDSQRASILSDVNHRLDEWVAEMGGVIKKSGEATYLIIFDRSALDVLFGNKFEILDRIRTIQAGNKIPVTLSIGVAAGMSSITDLGQKAQAGLDLALGRGGDQAAIYIDGKVQFYGGKTKATEKNTRVRARVIAQVLQELISDANNVLIMGHAHEDYDSLGAAIGVAKMALLQNKPTHIVVSSLHQTTSLLADMAPGYDRYRDLFISPQQAASLMATSTLLFVVDVHRPEITSAPDLLALTERKVLIDHHRRSESFITGTLLVYLEPSASSTSEMVTELLQYYDDNIDFNQLEATVLYAGIVLDTKNFAVQTGVRTFEAAAYLRRSGADPAVSQKLFKLDFSDVKARAEIIANAETLPRGIILAICPTEAKNIQVIAAQAADMMLNIVGVRAAFVLAATEEGVIVSARSGGEINVQVIMESMGGGGHQTVAGMQFKNTSVSEVRLQLIPLLESLIREEELNESDLAARS